MKYKENVRSCFPTGLLTSSKALFPSPTVAHILESEEEKAARFSHCFIGNELPSAFVNQSPSRLCCQ